MTIRNVTYNGQTYRETSVECKLTSVKDEVRENTNGTEYVWCEVEFVNRHGNVTKADAQIYKTNLDKGMVVGETYMLNVRKVEGQSPLLLVAPFSGGNKASDDDFGFDEVEAPAEKLETGVPAAAVDAVF